MPAQLFNLDWLNHNSQRQYPLAEGASKTDESGTLTLPDDVVLSLYFPVHAGMNVEPENFFVRRVTVYATGLSLTLAYNDGTTSPVEVASTSVSFSGHREYLSYALPGSGDFDDSVGKVVFGKPEALRGLPSGEYTFAYAAGRLDTDCVRPVIRGVTSVVLVNGSDRTDKLVGMLELVAGSNVVLSAAESGGVTSVRIDAIDGEGLTRDCVCTDEDDAPCIRTINGVPPTAQGDFTLQGDDCLTLTPISNGLRLEDQCSRPCCGCAELEAVTRDLERFGDAATSLQNFLNRLEGSVMRMNLTVLGSKLNDRNCSDCE